MWIRRIKVSGGYLKDFDVELTPGLNVIIGARGTGKSTLLRLIRWALGIDSLTLSPKEDKEFVATMLGSGEISLEVQTEHGVRLITVNAEGEGRSKEVTSNAALALGQNEIEDIASSGEERRHLLDLRAALNHTSDVDSNNELAKTTQEVYELRRQISDLADQTFNYEQLSQALREAEAQESSLVVEANENLAEHRARVALYDERLTHLSSMIAKAKHARLKLNEILSQTDQILSSISLVQGEKLPEELSHVITEGMSASYEHANQLRMRLLHALTELSAVVANVKEEQTNKMVKVTPLRAELEKAATGLGEITSTIRGLRTQLKEVESVRERIRTTRKTLERIETARGLYLDRREQEQMVRYQRRKSVAESVSRELGNGVAISVAHQADTALYTKELERFLKGSGMQYRALVDRISEKLLPRELLEMTEAQDAKALAAALSISSERAARILAAFDSAEATSTLSNIQLDDKVDFLLIQGSSMKSVHELSTGQKCAVTLPIVISDTKRALILDQPEDHLDNEFLVDNIVQAVLRRNKSSAQSIIATHSPNIPVLGNAELVIHMASDGRRGWAASAGLPDAPNVKGVITNILEGGEEAFQRRAEFYGFGSE